jgi:hypothetical protein
VKNDKPAEWMWPFTHCVPSTAYGAAYAGWMYPHQHGGSLIYSESPELCALSGGHCYENSAEVWQASTTDGAVPQVCKHCGKRRVAIPQPPYRYEYPDDEGEEPPSAAR